MAFHQNGQNGHYIAYYLDDHLFNGQVVLNWYINILKWVLNEILSLVSPDSNRYWNSNLNDDFHDHLFCGQVCHDHLLNGQVVWN